MKSIVSKERLYVPYHDQINIARKALERVEKKEIGWIHECHVVIVFSAIAIESISNTYGELLFESEWENYDLKPTTEKIKIISKRLDLVYSPKEEPWKHLGLAFDLRKKMVHSKPEDVRFEKIVSVKDLEKVNYEFPPSELERKINKSNAKKVLNCAIKIRDIFYEAIGEKGHANLFMDGYTGSSTLIRS